MVRSVDLQLLVAVQQLCLVIPTVDRARVHVDDLRRFSRLHS